MRIDLPTCNLKTCRHCFDGNCTDRNAYDRCEYALTVYGKEIVHVVRCKDCKWWCTDCMPEEFGWCDATVNRSTDEDWFCADGERKDDEQID